MFSHGFRPRSQPGHHVAIIEFVRARIDKKHAGFLILSIVCLAPANRGLPAQSGGAMGGSALPESCAASPKLSAVRAGGTQAPRTAAGYNGLGAKYAEAGDYACAISLFRAALALEPALWQAHFNLAQALQDAGQADNAADEFRAALDLHHPFALGDYDLAQLLSSQKKYVAAIFYLKEGLARTPPDDLHAQMNLALAVAHAQQGDYAAAIPILQQLVARQPSSAELHYDLGTAYAHRERYLNAADEYRKALQVDPNHDAARLSLAKALMNQSNVEGALPYAQEYAGRKPADAEGFQVLGEALRAAGRTKDAEAALRRSVQLDATSYKARYELGAALARLGKDDEAIAELEAARKIKPDGAEAIYQLGRLLARRKSDAAAKRALENFQEIRLAASKRAQANADANRGNEQLAQGRARQAAEAYRQALRLSPHDAKTHFNLSIALAKLGDGAGEQAELEAAVRLDPNYAQARNQLGLSYLAARRTAEAEREFKAAIAADPAYAEAENNLGVLYGREGRAGEAEAMFRRAADDDPQYAQASLNWGLSLASQGQLADAVEKFQKAIQLRADFADAETALGMAEGKLGQTKEAVATFQKVVALEPRSSLAHLNLGIALADQYDKPSALAEFKQAIRLDANSAVAHFNLGRLLYDAGRREDAGAEFDSACRLNPDYPDALYFLALLERQAGNLPGSVEALEHLVKIQPQNSNAQYLLGQNLLSLGKSDQAIDRWEAAVEADPDNASALYNLARVLQKSNRPESKQYQDRLAALEQKRQLTDRVHQLGNFALDAFKARDWPLAIEQSHEALKICGQCSESASLHRNLGLIYCQKGDLPSARRELEAALKIDPNDAQARKAVAILDSLSPAAGTRRARKQEMFP